MSKWFHALYHFGPWKEEFFSILLSYSSKRSVMGASMISADAEKEEKADDGLVAGHMYSILQVRRAGATLGIGGRGLHSSTFQLNLSRF